jgi:hypothetical protein
MENKNLYAMGTKYDSIHALTVYHVTRDTAVESEIECLVALF